MKQRTGIARALVNNPEILLMDEPFSSLDYLTKLKIREFILKILKKRQITTLLVTHDIEEAISLSDRIIILGKIPSSVRKIIHVTKDDLSLKDHILKIINSS